MPGYVYVPWEEDLSQMYAEMSARQVRKLSCEHFHAKIILGNVNQCQPYRMEHGQHPNLKVDMVGTHIFDIV